MRIVRLVSLCVLCLFSVSPGQAGSIDLTVRSILVGQIGFPNMNTVEQFTIGGTHTNSLSMAFSGLAESLTVLGNHLFVGDSSGIVRLIDAASGNVVSSFNAGTVGLDGLGTYQSNILALPFSSTSVFVYSSSGVLQATIALARLPPVDWNGVASDGTSLFVADSGTGLIIRYSIGGAQLGSFDPGIGGLSGVAYDASTDSLWVANGFATASTRGVYQFSKTGTPMSFFLTPGVAPNAGIAVTSGPASQTPTAVSALSTWAAVLLGILLAASAALQLRKDPQISR